ncbi:hypothetical protein [Streptomyces sp. NRRL S-920]|uniref:hypothetical protein n=1 Tax=Streptomyces sp. NRRL S-920 TaxID=1463921 RepID=UPI00131DF7A0|nr:hypothetical protein [Streptomyces sp. NRRL S-920]
MPSPTLLAAPDESTAALWDMVRPKHTDHEFGPTPEDEHTHEPSRADEVYRSIDALTE